MIGLLLIGIDGPEKAVFVVTCSDSVVDGLVIVGFLLICGDHHVIVALLLFNCCWCWCW